MLPPKLPHLQRLEIETDESERLFSINLMGMKPSFWSGQVAHVAKAGPALSTATLQALRHQSGTRLTSGSVQGGVENISTRLLANIQVVCTLCPSALHLGASSDEEEAGMGQCHSVFISANSNDESISVTRPLVTSLQNELVLFLGKAQGILGEEGGNPLPSPCKRLKMSP